MSYILNALRKSEQERNPETGKVALDSARIEQDSTNSSRIRWFLSLLFTLNLGFLGYMVVDKFQPLQTIPEYEPIQPMPEPSPAPVQTHVIQESGAISEWVAARQKIVPAPKMSETKALELPQEPLKKSPIKSIANKAEAKIIQPKQQAQPESEDELTEKLADLSKIIPKPVEVRSFREDRAAIKNESTAVVSGIPLLRDLDGDFQSKVPTVHINVLAYDNLPSARFVIIDMIKYRTGQQISSGLQLKEILPDSLVLSYEGRNFRIERP